jgi:hypothetical protein
MILTKGFTIGTARGYDWKLLRICDVLRVSDETEAYFLFINNEPTYDYFLTLKALINYVNTLPDVVDKT